MITMDLVLWGPKLCIQKMVRLRENDYDQFEAACTKALHELIRGELEPARKTAAGEDSEEAS